MSTVNKSNFPEGTWLRSFELCETLKTVLSMRDAGSIPQAICGLGSGQVNK